MIKHTDTDAEHTDYTDAERIDRRRARARQELRRSNAAAPIPAGKHKRPRAMVRQSIRAEYGR